MGIDPCPAVTAAENTVRSARVHPSQQMPPTPAELRTRVQSSISRPSDSSCRPRAYGERMNARATLLFVAVTLAACVTDGGSDGVSAGDGSGESSTTFAPTTSASTVNTTPDGSGGTEAGGNGGECISDVSRL